MWTISHRSYYKLLHISWQFSVGNNLQVTLTKYWKTQQWTKQKPRKGTPYQLLSAGWANLLCGGQTWFLNVLWELDIHPVCKIFNHMTTGASEVTQREAKTTKYQDFFKQYVRKISVNNIKCRSHAICCTSWGRCCYPVKMRRQAGCGLRAIVCSPLINAQRIWFCKECNALYRLLSIHLFLCFRFCPLMDFMPLRITYVLVKLLALSEHTI